MKALVLILHQCFLIITPNLFLLTDVSQVNFMNKIQQLSIWINSPIGLIENLLQLAIKP